MQQRRNLEIRPSRGKDLVSGSHLCRKLLEVETILVSGTEISENQNNWEILRPLRKKSLDITDRSLFDRITTYILVLCALMPVHCTHLRAAISTDPTYITTSISNVIDQSKIRLL